MQIPVLSRSLAGSIIRSIKLPFPEHREKDALFQLERSKTSSLESRVLQLEAELESKQQAITLLVAEKTSLTTSLLQLEDIEASTFASLHPMSQIF
jgi:hypothetical protein